MASKLSALQQKMRKKLQGAQFRWINEQLYTEESTDSFRKFQDDPALFDVVRTAGVSATERLQPRSTTRDFALKFLNGL